MKKVNYLTSQGEQRTTWLSAGEYLALSCHKLDLAELKEAIQAMNSKLAEAIQANQPANSGGKGAKPKPKTIILREYQRLSGRDIETKQLRWLGDNDSLGTIISRYNMIITVGDAFGGELLRSTSLYQPVPYKNMLTYTLLTRASGPRELIQALLGKGRDLTDQHRGYAYLAEKLVLMPSTPTTSATDTAKAVKSYRTILYYTATGKQGINKSAYGLLIGLAELAQELGLEISDIFKFNEQELVITA